MTVEDSKKPKILSEFYMYTMNYIKDLEKELLDNHTESVDNEDSSEESSEESNGDSSEDDGLGNDGDSLIIESLIDEVSKNNPTEISDENKCEYCKNIILDQSLKSVIYHKKNSRVVRFCNSKCFENKSFKK